MEYASADFANRNKIMERSFQPAALGYDDLTRTMWLFIQGYQKSIQDYFPGKYTFIAPLYVDIDKNVTVDLSQYMQVPQNTGTVGQVLTKGFGNTYSWQSGGGGGGSMYLGTVGPGDVFPTTRPGGAALQTGDYVKPQQDAVFPFTVGTVTFTTNKDTAIWLATEWVLNANPYQNTGETPVKDKMTETLSQTANTQYAANKEFVVAINSKVDKFSTLTAPTAQQIADGLIVQYTGPTTSVAPIYTNGYFYKATTDAGAAVWKPIDIQRPVLVDNTSIYLDASQQISVMTSGITTDKIADGAVTTDKIAALAVITAKIADAAVTDVKLADDSVITAKIKDSNVTFAKLASSVYCTAISSTPTDTVLPTEKAVYDFVKQSSGTVLAVETNKLNLKNTAGTVLSSVTDNQLSTLVAGDTTIEVNVSGKLHVKDDSIQAVKFKSADPNQKGKAYLVQADGSFSLQRIRQYKRVSTFTGVDGDDCTWYYLDTPAGTYAVGTYIWSSAQGFKLISSGSTSGAMFVGTVSAATVAFPTMRPDGTALVLGDYVKPTGTLPFTLGDVTFTSAKDQAVYLGTKWVLNASPYQSTSQTPVNNKTNESINGASSSAGFQDAINKQNATAINSLMCTGTFSKDGVGKLTIVVKNRLGTVISTGSVSDVVFTSDTQTLTNKTVDADNNTISNLEVDNFKAGVVDTATLYTSDDTHIASSKLIYTQIQNSKKGFTFVGYVSNLTPAAGKKDQLWYQTASTQMPTTFPILVHRFDGTAWSSTTENYTPKNLDLWSNKNNEHGYYWFGNAWNLLDFNAGVDDATIHYNDASKLAVKDNGLAPAKFTSLTSSDQGKTFIVASDGKWSTGYIPQYKRVSTLTGQTGNTYTWYYLDKPDGSDAQGTYIWDATSGFTLISSGSAGGSLFVGTVSQASTALPATRPDGSALVLGDYVKPDTTATVPFTVGGITFTSLRDTAVYMGSGNWLLNASVFQRTHQTPVNNKADESINGAASTAVYQADINKENVTALKGRVQHYDTMPAASADLQGSIVQYVGATTSTAPIYTNGYFYKCINDSGTYKWQNIYVQDAGNAVQKVLNKSYTRAQWAAQLTEDVDIIVGTGLITDFNSSQKCVVRVSKTSATGIFLQATYQQNTYYCSYDGSQWSAWRNVPSALLFVQELPTLDIDTTKIYHKKTQEQEQVGAIEKTARPFTGTQVYYKFKDSATYVISGLQILNTVTGLRLPYTQMLLNTTDHIDVTTNPAEAAFVHFADRSGTNIDSKYVPFVSLWDNVAGAKIDDGILYYAKGTAVKKAEYTKGSNILKLTLNDGTTETINLSLLSNYTSYAVRTLFSNRLVQTSDKEKACVMVNTAWQGQPINEINPVVTYGFTAGQSKLYYRVGNEWRQIGGNVLVDDTTIAVQANTLYVKDGGISFNKLQASSVAKVISSTAPSQTKVTTQSAVKTYVDTFGKTLAVSVDDKLLSLKDASGAVCSSVTSSQISSITKDDTVALTNKTIDVDSNTVSNIEVDNMKASAISTSIPNTGTVDTKFTTEKAVRDALNAAAIQVSVLPTPAAAVAGRIVQYIGADTTTATRGYFYMCTFDGAAYKWIPVSTMSVFKDVSDLPTTGITDFLLYRVHAVSTVLTRYDITDHTMYAVGVNGITNQLTGDTENWVLVTANWSTKWQFLVTENAVYGEITRYNMGGVQYCIDTLHYTAVDSYSLYYHYNSSWHLVGSGAGGGGGAAGDYQVLVNRPMINLTTLTGSKSSKELSIIWEGTQAEYNALAVKNPITLYCITDDGPVTTNPVYSKAEVDSLLLMKQNITDTSLSTANKQIVPAINELLGDIRALIGGVTIKVVPSTPATPTNNTVYYVGTAAPYMVYLYTTLDGWVYLGTSDADLSVYQTKECSLTEYTATTVQGILSEIKVLLNGKLQVSDIIDNVTSTAADKPLSAKQGKLLSDDIATRVKTADIVDELTSTAVNKPLSANQGRVLNEKIDTKQNKITVSTEMPTGGSDGDIWFKISE